MIRARELLQESFKFLLNNPLLFFYGFISLLPIMITFVAMVLLALSAGTLSLLTLSFPEIIRNIFAALFGSFFALFFTVLFFFMIIVISLGFTVYVQAHLKGSDLSLRNSLKKSFALCTHVLWFVPVYIIYIFVNNSCLWILSSIIFCYVPQLVVDGETSLIKAFSLSLHYFKKTFWVMLRFFILIGLVMVCLIFLTTILLGLAGLFRPVFPASLVFSLLAMVTFFSIFLFWLTSSILMSIGINKLYLEPQEKN